MPQRTVNIFDGSTFVVSDSVGDLDSRHVTTHGFFSEDTRFLSRWQLSVDGGPTNLVSVTELDYFATQFFLTNAAKVLSDPPISVIRRRLVRGSMREELMAINHTDGPISLHLRLEIEADFADLFEVKDDTIRQRHIRREVSDNELRLIYEGANGFHQEVAITAAGSPCRVDEYGLSFQLDLRPHQQWMASLAVTPTNLRDGESAAARPPAGRFDETEAEMREDLHGWLAAAPTLSADWDAVTRTYKQSLADLAALRLHPASLPGESLPAAGLPWFMALFGRDSLIASYQAIAFKPELAAATLRVLASAQGTQLDDFRDQEPGKILHELRLGELTAIGERPHSPYYGTADATPLFLVLLDEYERWSGDTGLVRELEPNARAALAWIDDYADLTGSGFVEYKRRNELSGLRNQCWKDSWNSIAFSDGSLAEAPIASSEIQGYAYDAKLRCARLAIECWDDPELAARLTAEAEELKRNFVDRFWLPERGFYALALDGDGKAVDSLTSNIGHLLWSGIVADEHADQVADALMGESLFSGWGIRTMATSEHAYNPLGYHVGTIWPHDTSLVVAGLARYGYREEAGKVAEVMFEASSRFGYRLPEAFAGYDRSFTRAPVQYPTASRPQAWAAAAPLLLLRSVLGLEPEDGTLQADPVVPERFGRIELEGLPGAWGTTGVSAGEALATHAG